MRSRTLLIVAVTLALLTALYALAGFVLLPKLVMSKAPQLLQDSGHRLRLGEFHFNPFTLRARAADITVEDAQGRPVAGIAQAAVALQWRSLPLFTPLLSEVRLVKPVLHVDIDKDGQLNLAALARPDPKVDSTAQTGSTLPRFRIGTVALEDGQINFTDQRKPYSNRFEHLALTLSSVSTLDAEKGKYTLNARTPDGATLRWQGDMSLQPLSASGMLEMSGVLLPALMPYLDPYLAGQITSGRAELKLPHHFEIRDGRPQITLADATITVADFALGLPDAGTNTPVAANDGATLRWQGDMSLQAQSASGMLEASGVLLPALMPYLDPYLAGQITSGRAELKLPHHFEIRDGRPQITLADATITVADFALGLPDAGTQAPAAVKLDQFAVQGLALDLQKKQLSVQQLGLSGLAVAAQRNARGRLDLEDIVKHRPADESEPWAVSIERTELDKASVAFTDAGTRMSLGLQDIRARVDKLSTDASTPLSFELKAGLRDSNGSLIARGEATPATAAFKARMELTAIPLALMQPLMDAQARVRIASGEATLTGELSQGDKTPLRFAGDAGISDVSLVQTGDTPRPVMKLKDFALQGIALDVPGQQLSVQQARIAGLAMDVKRDADGKLDLQDLLVPASTQVATGAASTPAAPWKAHIARVELSDSSLSVADAGLGQTLGLDGITASAGDLSNDSSRPISFELKAGLRDSKGVISARGQATPASGALKARVEAGAIPLALFQSLIDAHTRARIVAGTASVAGELQLGGKESFRYSGRVSLDELAMDEAASTPAMATGQPAGSSILGWKSLVTDNLSISGMPLRINMDELRLIAPRGRLAIAADSSLNMRRAFTPMPKPVAPGDDIVSPPVPVRTDGAPAADPESGISLDLRRLRITQGQLQFSDDSLSTGFTTQIHALEGTFSELSSDRNIRSQFSLEGGVDEFGFARLSGSLNPFQLRDRTTLRVEFRNLDLSRATPYAIKFAGYRIASGRLSLDLRYTVRDSLIEGSNAAVFDQLVLGERVESPTALDLPISLAVSLLKDAEGRINISIPISGNLDDPKFDYTALIWQAVGNVISGIITAPFRALASLFGGTNQADEVRAIAFEPGQSRLLPPEREKLQKVAGALAKRPELKLLVPGHAETLSDGERLKRAALSREIARRAGFEVAEDESAGGLSIQDKRTRDAIRALFTERIGEAELDRLKTEAEAKALKDNADKPGILDKLRNFAAGEPQLADARPFYATLMRRLRETEPLSPEALQQLAQARSAGIIATLREAGVAAERMQASIAATTEGSAQAREVKVELELAAR